MAPERMQGVAGGDDQIRMATLYFKDWNHDLGAVGVVIARTIQDAPSDHR